MCDRCEETKAAFDHTVVAALKLAKLTKTEVVVGFIGEAIVIMPLGLAEADVTVANVRHDATAQDLKNQVSAFMALLRRKAHIQELEDLVSTLRGLREALAAQLRPDDVGTN